MHEKHPQDEHLGTSMKGRPTHVLPRSRARAGNILITFRSIPSSFTPSSITRLLLPIILFITVPLIFFLTQQGQGILTLQGRGVKQLPPRGANPIQQENQLPGTPGWQLSNAAAYVGSRFPAIEGYPMAQSATAGETLSFAVSTNSQSFTADMYRLGWYGGVGARLVTSIPNIPGHFYPIPPMDSSTGLVDAHWPAAFTVTTDPSWVTGMYLVRLTAVNGKQNYIPFVIRSRRPAALMFIHADNTDQAYNPWGGKSLYEFNSSNRKRAYKVSYNRPLAVDEHPGWGNLFYWEYPMIRYLEKQGYDLEYGSSVDTYTDANIFRNRAGVLLVGHQEYWTKEARDHLEAAINQGVNLAVFAADTMSWQIRYEPSHNMQNRIIVCYKDASLDPLTGKDNSHVTVDPAQSPLNRPEQSLLGSMHRGYFTRNPGYPWVVADASSWIFAGTNLKKGDSLPGLVGYEYDRVFSAYLIPPRDTIVASSPVHGIGRPNDLAQSTVYTAKSGAQVFNASTIQWSVGLDDFGSIVLGFPPVVNPLAQKITDNILQKFLFVQPRSSLNCFVSLYSLTSLLHTSIIGLVSERLNQGARSIEVRV